MKILKLLNEAQSHLFHYTNVHALHKILTKKEFRLSVQKMKHEQEIGGAVGQGDKTYYMSLARSRFGEYHSYPGNMSVLLDIDGAKLNNFGKIKSVDYWGIGPGAMKGKDEMEDRLFADEPTIPIDGLIRSASVFIRPESIQTSEQSREILRQTLLMCKTNGIELKVYTDEKKWRIGRGGNINLSSLNLKGHRKDAPYFSVTTLDKDVDPYIELLMSPITSELSAKAKKIAYVIRWYGNEGVGQLNNIIHNDGQAANNHRLDSFFRVINKLKLNNAKEIAEFIKDKWKDVKM